MSHRRQQRRAEKTRRHAQPPPPIVARAPSDPPAVERPARAVVREARYVERLAYTGSQAARALGISRSTLRRLLPYVETIEMPWGAKLIPVDELERLVSQRRRAAASSRPPVSPGRKPAIPPEVAERIHAQHSRGKSLREIAADLNAERTPTAHGGKRWWPSTVRAVLHRAA